MHRLCLKLFVVLAVVAGPVLGFAPDASAHKNTNTVATVIGDVGWPQLPKTGLVDNLDPSLTQTVPGTPDLTCLNPANAGCAAGFDLRRHPGFICPGLGLPTCKDDPNNPNDQLISGLSLDLRAIGSGSLKAGKPLNGCRLKNGNTSYGLPLAGDTHLLCFAFSDFTIEAAGIYKGLLHATDFDCVSSGTTGASGSDQGENITQKRLGAFYGEFTCDGAPATVLLPGLPSADGHFHGLSRNATIAFLGEVYCRADLGHDCDDKGPLPDPKLDRDRIKHTLACKGNVTDPRGLEKEHPKGTPGQPAGIVHKAQVRLECVIA